MFKGLKKLFDIVNKNYYTRLDFFNLINNHDIQESRGITNDDVINWSKSIIDMNVYRNNEVSDDWEYAKMRVLMSKVSGINDVDNNVVEVLNNEYIPYTNISFDDESIIKFVSLIDDLKQWKDIIQNIEFLNNENYRVTLAQSHEDADSERANLQMMEDYRVEGIIISACHNRKNTDIYKDLIDKGIPMVFIDRTVDNIPVSQVK